MALMQASSIAAPKRMMSPLGPASGHGSAQRDAQDRGTQGHMVLPTSMTCPPLLLRKEADFTAPRLLDEKEMRPNEDMQLKKKNRKSGTPSKVREQEGQAGKAVVDENGNCPLSKVQKNFICDHCYGAFRSGYHLKRHILIHTGEKPFACAVCDMRFIQRYHLERHSLTHTGVKPYACSMCDMRFFQRYHLERHSLTHTELLTDRQTVETSAIVSGSRRGKSRGPAMLFHPGASRSPSVHVESSTPRPGPTRCLTPYSLDKP
uniref:Gastrula zinc finger protein XlCGF46.1-like n=1 Tax=Sinocyclocheilus grahami TaxID=75366 RepID=A0A672K0U2_SINGR